MIHLRHYPFKYLCRSVWILFPLTAMCQDDLELEIRREQERVRSLRLRSEISIAHGRRIDTMLFDYYELRLFNVHGDVVYTEAPPCCETYLLQEAVQRRDQMIRNTDSTGNLTGTFISKLKKQPVRSRESYKKHDPCHFFYNYDQSGRKILETSFYPAGEIPWQQRVYAYDQAGNLVSKKEFIGDRADDLKLNYELEFRYDTAGRKILQYEAGHDSMVFNYDNRSRLSAVIRYEPGAGIGFARIYTYSDSGYTITFKQHMSGLSDSIVQIYDTDLLAIAGYERYDTADRRLEYHMPAYDSHILHTYDSLGNITSDTYNNKGRTEYDYDNQHRKSAMHFYLDTGCSTTFYEYNDRGQLTAVTDYMNDMFGQHRMMIYTYFAEPKE